MSESNSTCTLGADVDNHPLVAAVPLGDLLGTIREAVQAKVNLVVAHLAALSRPPSSRLPTSSATSGEFLHTTRG